MLDFKKRDGSRLKLGVLANEFFDLGHGRMGGFGWATQQVGKTFADASLGVDIVYVEGKKQESLPEEPLNVRGIPLIQRDDDARAFKKALKAAEIDAWLLIDFRPDYKRALSSLWRTPVVLWARDPRTKKDEERIEGIRIPGYDGMPGGLKSPDCTSFRDVVKRSRLVGRKVAIGTPSEFLKEKARSCYDIPGAEIDVLPNIVDMDPGEIVKSERPSAVFLGRLDPYKRPWVLAEIARRCPEVDFHVLGRAHFEGEGGWVARDLPPNFHLAGHADEATKTRYLREAWMLVNTSVHEGLAVSFQEALRCETPVLSSVDPEKVVSRFGIYTGDFLGSGMDALPEFVGGVEKLVNDHDFRRERGREGCEWVQSTHTRALFLESFHALCRRVGAI